MTITTGQGPPKDNPIIPTTVPLVGVDFPQKIILPTSYFMPFLFVGEVSSDYLAELRKQKFAVMAPKFYVDEEWRAIGVLGEFKELANADYAAEVLNFKGLLRVSFTVSKGPSDQIIQHYAHWRIMEFIPLSLEEIQSPDFQSSIERLKSLFNEIIQILKDRDPDAYRDLLELRFVQELLKEVEAFKIRDDIAQLLDKIMTLLNYYHFIEDEELDYVILATSNNILFEKSVYKRLLEIISLLEEINHYFIGEGRVADRSQNIEGPPASAPEDIFKPREVQPRFTITQSAEKPADPLIVLAVGERSSYVEKVMRHFDQHVIGQERGKRHLASILTRLRQGYGDRGRPVIGGFFTGPSGVGKTEIVKVLARYLFGDTAAYTHIECNEFQQEHQVSALIGASPGYIGYDSEPKLSQWRIDQYHIMSMLGEKHRLEMRELRQDIQRLEKELNRSTSIEELRRISRQIQAKNDQLLFILNRIAYRPGQHYSIILFDEIERAHPKFFDLLLRILNEGQLDLMNGESTNFTKSIICFTSNIYGSELMKALTGQGIIGIRPPEINDSMQARFKSRTWKEVLNAVERHFTFNPAFLGRVGKENIIVFYPLSTDELLKILDQIYIPAFVQDLVKKSGIESFGMSQDAKVFLIEESQDATNIAFGARALQRVFEKRVEDPIVALIDRGEEGGLVAGDRIWVDVISNSSGAKEIVIHKGKS